MNYFLTACGLILHTVFWGAGLAVLMLPARWRRFWWMFAPGAGMALQSAVVWTGAQTALEGTDAYAWPSEALPAIVLAVALWRHRRGRTLWAGWRTMAAVAAIALVAGWLLVAPMRTATRGLSTTSLGSCDQADYAAGARVFQEFSRHDRTGFMGLGEVTRVRSAEHFFEVWARLNHFTPAALLAHHGTILGLQPHQAVSLMAAVLVLLNLPVVLLVARMLAGLRGAALLLAVAVFAISPLQAYAVHHGALGQLCAAQGIALLTLAVVAAGRREMADRSGRRWLPAMIAAFWLLAGSYNFILVVCLAPAAAWLGWETWRRDRPAALLRTTGWVAAAFAVVALAAWGRIDGLLERFGLFEQYNFGWTVPLASPEGWLGLVRSAHRGPWPSGVRMTLAGAIVLGWVGGFAVLWRRDAARAALVGALVLPVIAGWTLLALEARERANATYDAYKLLSVFYPGLLAGLLAGLAAAMRAAGGGGRAVTGLLALVLAANAIPAARMHVRMMRPPLQVDRELVQLAALEGDARIDSLNLRVADFWSRLWANAFLLRKAQYFETHTYEGRLNTALRGGWDLSDSRLRAVPLAAGDYLAVNDQFHVVRTGAPGRLMLAWGEGWHAEERLGPLRWRWAGESGRLVVENPAERPLRVRVALQARGREPGTLLVAVGRDEVAAGGAVRRVTLAGGGEPAVNLGEWDLAPGRTEFRMWTEPAAAPAAPGDARVVSFALFGAEFVALGWPNDRPDAAAGGPRH